MHLPRPAEREAEAIVDRLLDEAARTVEEGIAIFRCIFTVLLILLNLAEHSTGPPLLLRTLVLGVAVAAFITSVVVVREARKPANSIRNLARFSVGLDGLLLMTPAIGYCIAPVDSSYLTLPGIPILYLAVVVSGLRYFRGVLFYSLGVYGLVACGWLGVDFLVGNPPQLIEILYYALHFVSASLLALILSTQTRRLTLSGATNALTANVDGLTGVKNRRFLRSYLDEAVGQALKSSKPLSVVMADIDHFKSINDTHGHAAGDAVLKAVANAISGTLREGDLVARYGGEEFSLVLSGANSAVAGEVAERVRGAIEALIVSTGDQHLSVTISLGAAEFQPGDADVGSLLRRADAALYQAKESGRNRVVVSS